MYRASPGVERAVEAAKAWAERLGSGDIRLVDLLLGLLDEDEGRPAVLLERNGLTVPTVRDRLTALPAPPVAQLTRLYTAARDWSLANRADPEFLTDAFLLATLRADDHFRVALVHLGLDPDALELTLMAGVDQPTEP